MNPQIVKKLLDSSNEQDVYLGIQYLYKLTPEEIETFWKFRNKESYKTGCNPTNFDRFTLHGYLLVFHGHIQNWGRWVDQVFKEGDFGQFTDLTPDI